MATEGVDIEQLSPTQQSALQTYTAVTGDEPSTAIPLLQRSEWNVQVSQFLHGFFIKTLLLTL